MRNAMNKRLSRRLVPPAVVLLAMFGSGLAGAQDAPLEPSINRNPAYRDQLPPNPVPAPSPRYSVVPQPGPDDPRDSDTRPVQRPGGGAERNASAPTSTGPTPLAPSAPDRTRR